MLTYPRCSNKCCDIKEEKSFEVDWAKVITTLLLIALVFFCGRESSKYDMKEHYKDSMMHLCKYEAFANDVHGFMYDAEKEECVFIYD